MIQQQVKQEDQSEGGVLLAGVLIAEQQLAGGMTGQMAILGSGWESGVDSEESSKLTDWLRTD